MRDKGTTAVLLAVLVFIAIATSLLYIFPLSNTAHAAEVSANSASLSKFFSAYGFKNGTNLASFYNVQNGTNEIIMSCNYGIKPAYMSIPLLQEVENSTAYSEYSSFVYDIGLFTACGFNDNLSGCSVMGRNIYNLSTLVMNTTTVITLLSQTKTLMYATYAVAQNSTLRNSSFFYPVFNDTKIINATFANKSSVLKSLISLVPIPQYVFNYNDSTVVDPFYLDVPFRFHSLVFPFKQSCAGSVFNLVSNITEFSNPIYTSLYSALGSDLTNVCINSSNNRCTGQVMKEFNFSFYEQS